MYGSKQVKFWRALILYILSYAILAVVVIALLGIEKSIGILIIGIFIMSIAALKEWRQQR
jgi:hypothetical protein